MSDEIRKPAYFAIIPAKVRYDTSLRPNAKLLYAEITALADARGYCWSSNDYFAKLFDLSPKTISDLIGTLDKRGYITVEVVRDEATNEVQERRLWVEQRGTDTLSPPPPKNKGRGGPPKNGDTSPQKCGDPPPKNGEKNNTSINNTPPPPKGGQRKGSGLSDKARAMLNEYVAGDRELTEAMVALMEIRELSPKAKNTDRAVKMLLAELDELSGGDREAKLKIVKQSVLSGWVKVYSLKGGRASPQSCKPREEVPTW